MEQLANTLRSGLTEILAAIVLAVLSLAAAYAVAYIRRAQSALEARTQAEIVDRTIARAAALAESTVLALESTVAKQLREAVKDGRADRAELMALGSRAVEDVLRHLGAEGRQLLEESVGDVRDFVRDLVEAQVERLKQGALTATLEQIAPNSSGPAAS